MKIYDSTILKVNELLSNDNCISLKSSSNWKNSEEKVFIFKDDGAVELGATSCKSTYLIAFTSNNELINKDEILLIGKDIYELNGDSSYARITLINIDDDKFKNDQESYRILRNIEYKRYKINPSGFMIRVNTNQIREGGRVSRDAVLNKISFNDIGTLLMNEYKKEPSVRFVKQIFITDPNFNYDELASIAKTNEGITVALDHILKNLKMDCNTCNFKGICDEIEGMRDIHKKEEYKM